MKYFNDYDIQRALDRHRSHAVLGPAAQFLREYKDQVDAHSDGWAYWVPPVRAAEKLMLLLEQTDATDAQLKAALRPIKSFYTRRGNRAGMVYPGKPSVQNHPLYLPDATIEIFDSAVNHAEAVLQVLLPDMSPKEITERFQTHVAIHMRTELEGAKRYGNSALKYRDAVNSGKESAF